MADNVHTATDGTVTSLVRGIVDDAQELMKQQFMLLKAEVQEDMRKTREAATSLVVGLTVSFLGGILLSIMLVHLLDWLVPGHPIWMWYAVVGGGITAVGIGMAVYANQQFRSFNPLPDQTAKALQENVEWTMNRR